MAQVLGLIQVLKTGGVPSERGEYGQDRPT